METKQVNSIEIKDAERGEIRAIIATTGTVDRDGDWTLRGAIPDGTKVKFSAYGHSVVTDGARPVGRGTISSSGDTVFVDGKFFMSTTEGRETFFTLKELGEDQQWSYGFKVVDTGEVTPEMKAAGVRRVLTKLLPLEVSPVLMGAGVGTATVSIKELMASVDGLPHAVGDFAYAPDPNAPVTWALPIFDGPHVQQSLQIVHEMQIPGVVWPGVRDRIIAAAQKFGVDATSIVPVTVEEAAERAAAEKAATQQAEELKVLEASRERFLRTRARLGW